MRTSTEALILILAGITAVWLVLSVFVLRRTRHRHREVAVLHARPRRRAMRPWEESGTFVPLATPLAEEPAAEPEPEPEPETELEPIDLTPPPGGLDAATTYEVVWYRDNDEDRIAFALQPVDGRAAPWARYRSASFSWAQDADPPADLKAAQSAHGRLRARLTRDGWRPAGRGDSWFGHRFAPPAAAPARRDD